MVQIVSFTLFALVLARVVGAPRGSWRYIIGVAALAVVASQLFLPSGHPLRSDVAESSRNLAWLAVAMVPVAIYGLWVRRLRMRTGVDRSPRTAAVHPVGLVQITDDAALARETEAGLLAETRASGLSAEIVSLGWRGPDGALEGHLRLRVTGSDAEVEMMRVLPERRRGGVGTGLLAAAEGEARDRGARGLVAKVGSWQAIPFFTAAGFRPVLERDAGNGQALHWLEKPLR